MSDSPKIVNEKRKKICALVVLLMLIITLTACQTLLPPQEMAGTVSRVDCILRCFDDYLDAIHTNAEAEAIAETADTVMAIFRNAFVTDWLEAMEIMHRSDEQSIEPLLTLIGSRVATARATDDDRYERSLAEIDTLRLNENEPRAQILQRLHANIEYFENPADIPPVENSVDEQSDTTIPSSLHESFGYLNELLSPEDIEWIKDSELSDLILLHFSLGMWMRNHWLNQPNSGIADELWDMGFTHLDNMSQFIIEAYHHYLNGLDYDTLMVW